MEAIQDFAGLTSRLRSLERRIRVAVVCPNDAHTEYVILRSLKEGFADFLLVADTPHLINAAYIHRQFPDHVKVYEASCPDKAAQEGVALVREGHADVLMKGIINTDNLLRAVLHKEYGLLPKGNILSHITVAQIPLYNKLLFFSDAAVIPRPTLEQFDAMLRYDVEVCRCMGIDEPRVALIHCTEKTNEKFPHTLDYVALKERAEAGAYGRMYLDGPMDVKTACDSHSGEVKGINSPVAGHADMLIFPNIESGNTFYKTVSLFGDANMAGMLLGTTAPVVVPSRADSGNSKFYSLVLACVCSEQTKQP
ncbi:MAG: phosphate butyryltransferase [Bacteroides sp.]|nr:phosphate butyryltransferase [Bacteroides sp.]